MHNDDLRLRIEELKAECLRLLRVSPLPGAQYHEGDPYMRILGRQADALRLRTINALRMGGATTQQFVDCVEQMQLSEKYVTGFPYQPDGYTLGALGELLDDVLSRLGPTKVPTAEKPCDAAGVPRKKTGPKSKDHTVVKRIAGRYPPWEDHLDEICEALDEEPYPIPSRWRSWGAKPKNWSDALIDNRRNVKKSIEYSIQQATRNKH